jgi:hypothetical protein
MATLTVAGRYNGPDGKGNGGYSAGLLAAGIDGPAVVSLRSPVPLDRPLDLVREDGTVRALDGETLVAEAEPAAPLVLPLPSPIGVAEARAAASGYAAPRESVFSRCFVCGPAREDCMEVFAGPVAGRPGLVATTWTPPAWSAGEDGAVRPEFVWAALDCPTYWAVYDRLVLGFLVRQQVDVEAPIVAGAQHVVLSWPLGVEGRKRSAGAALFDAGGRLLAHSEALLVEAR